MNTEASYPATNSPESEQPLFAEHDYFKYELASHGQRFANYLVDNLLMRFGLSWLTSYLVGTFLVNLFPEFYAEMILSEVFSYYFVLYLIVICNYLIYYTFCEKVFNGYTLGKLITGSRAIREDGGELTWKNAFMRSLSRMVPFEQFSIWFGDGLWHDTWTKTMVIRSR
jgi:uncharacterized RDD family membrane protein YckC